ncbi:ABC transporter ATP-binding protein [Magnetococcales bacterium HHB-1]
MSEVVLYTEKVGKSFQSAGGSMTIFKAIDFQLYRGEMVALLGVSGVGKSTFLQILGGLDRPSTGEVFLNDCSLYKQSEKIRATLRNQKIGFVYQSHRLLAEFTALENVMMPLLIRRDTPEKARLTAENVLKEVELEDRLHHKPGALSGGERQRVAIARAVVGQPDLLLADEPTGNLDGDTAERVFMLLRNLNATRKLSCVMVTHNATLAAKMDRQMVLHNGTILEQGNLL